MVSDANDPYTGSPENAAGYAGYLFNSDEKTYHVRHRTYLPESKRWLQRDPIGVVDGTDLYGYVRGNPSTWFDPHGLVSISHSVRLEGYLPPPLGVGGSAQLAFTYDIHECCEEEGEPSHSLNLHGNLSLTAGVGVGFDVDILGIRYGSVVSAGPILTAGGECSLQFPCGEDWSTAIDACCADLGAGAHAKGSFSQTFPSPVFGGMSSVKIQIGVIAGAEIKLCAVAVGPTRTVWWTVGGRGYTDVDASIKFAHKVLGITVAEVEGDLFDLVEETTIDTGFVEWASGILFTW